MVLSLPAFLLSIATLALMREEITVEQKSEKEEGNLRNYIWILTPYAISHATYNLVLRTTFTFTPTFLVEFKGMTVAAAGFMSMVLPAAGIFAKMSSGFIVEKTGPRNAICGASALSAVFLLSLVVFPGRGVLALNLLVLGLTLYSFSPIIYSSTTGSLPSGLKAVGLGLVTMFGNIVGAVSTSVVGALIDARGFEFTFYAIAVTTLIASGLIFGVMSKK
jgi:predicted MFS family arabinose efflux permease